MVNHAFINLVLYYFFPGLGFFEKKNGKDGMVK